MVVVSGLTSFSAEASIPAFGCLVRVHVIVKPLRRCGDETIPAHELNPYGNEMKAWDEFSVDSAFIWVCVRHTS